ncbi:MAG: hypothetical protein WBD41_27900 [Rhodococcus sp. (in: high G+C Gram-positive bacteria)]|jgi:hypothetical protein
MSAELFREDFGPEPVISTAGMALLLGVDEAELRDEIARQGGAERFQVPKQWVRQGRRRSKEYQAATGRFDMKAGE